MSKKRHAYAEDLALYHIRAILKMPVGCSKMLPGSVIKKVKEADKILKKRRKLDH